MAPLDGRRNFQSEMPAAMNTPPDAEGRQVYASSFSKQTRRCIIERDDTWLQFVGKPRLQFTILPCHENSVTLHLKRTRETRCKSAVELARQVKDRAPRDLALQVDSRSDRTGAEFGFRFRLNRPPGSNWSRALFGAAGFLIGALLTTDEFFPAHHKNIAGHLDTGINFTSNSNALNATGNVATPFPYARIKATSNSDSPDSAGNASPRLQEARINATFNSSSPDSAGNGFAKTPGRGN